DDGTLLEADAGAGEGAAGGSSSGAGTGFSAAQIALGSLLFGGIAAAAGGGGGSGSGRNSAPVITSGPQDGAVTEDAATTTATGRVTATDADRGAVLAYRGNADGVYGGFVVSPTTGAWTYTLDNSRA